LGLSRVDGLFLANAEGRVIAYHSAWGGRQGEGEDDREAYDSIVRGRSKKRFRGSGIRLGGITMDPQWRGKAAKSVGVGGWIIRGRGGKQVRG